MGIPSSERLDPEILELIQYKAGKLAVNRTDREDAAQDLALYLVRFLRTFDPARASRRTFANRIIDSKSLSILQHHRAVKRGRGKVKYRSVDDVDVPDVRDRGSTDMRLDIRAAVSKLPPENRAIATLFETFTEAEIVKRTGMSRQQVRGLKSKLAQRLAHLRPS